MKNNFEIRKIFELAIIYNKRISLIDILPTRALRDRQSETAYEDFLNSAIPICKKIDLSLSKDDSNNSLNNLFAFASYISHELPDDWSTEMISESISNCMLMEFDMHNWLHENRVIPLDLTSDLAKLILEDYS